MEEHNKKTLIEGLSSLREYEPPESTWDAIEQQMEDEVFFTKKQLHDLPAYDPPERLWDRISDRLGQPTPVLLLNRAWRRTLVIAASLLVLLAAWWQFGRQDPIKTAAITVTYSTETADDLLLSNDWQEDEEAFEQFRELCESREYICEHPEFQLLQSELDELTEAKLSIVEAMGDYGPSPELVNQVTDIELERTDILKKMMAMLI